MAGIAGIASPGRTKDVIKMLERIRHRGIELKTVEENDATLGVVLPQVQNGIETGLDHEGLICDEASSGHFACVKNQDEGMVLSRDTLGVVPLYYGRDPSGALCFASEVKGLLAVTRDVHELMPGTRLVDGQVETEAQIPIRPFTLAPAVIVAAELRHRLRNAVRNSITTAPGFGSLLSGGLDSSVIAAIARPFTERLHTFASGLEGAPDLIHARDVARHLKVDHHERIVRFEEMLSVLPDVIYHLESFDALLVRSSIMHYLAAQAASGYVPAVFSGEGGDELFAGYGYLKKFALKDLPGELLDITHRLHNTALQRVDRCTMAHGVTAWVPFLDPAVVEYAISIPPALKMNNGVEKWILREAARGLLPVEVVDRPKAKFWEGSGVADRMAVHAGRQISDRDFERERILPNGWKLNTKEELFYYRIFRERFGLLNNLGWMGRTKGAPVQ